MVTCAQCNHLHQVSEFQSIGEYKKKTYNFIGNCWFIFEFYPVFIWTEKISYKDTNWSVATINKGKEKGTKYWGDCWTERRSQFIFKDNYLKPVKFIDVYININWK